MDLKITDKKDEPLLFRTQIIAEGISEAATPSNAEVKKALASELKCSEDIIVIQTIKTYFGSLNFQVRAYKYKDVDSMKKVIKQKKVKEKKEDAQNEQKKA